MDFPGLAGTIVFLSPPRVTRSTTCPSPRVGPTGWLWVRSLLPCLCWRLSIPPALPQGFCLRKLFATNDRQRNQKQHILHQTDSHGSALSAPGHFANRKGAGELMYFEATHLTNPLP